jgi:hypothetical protein
LTRSDLDLGTARPQTRQDARTKARKDTRARPTPASHEGAVPPVPPPRTAPSAVAPWLAQRSALLVACFCFSAHRRGLARQRGRGRFTLGSHKQCFAAVSGFSKQGSSPKSSVSPSRHDARPWTLDPDPGTSWTLDPFISLYSCPPPALQWLGDPGTASSGCCSGAVRATCTTGIRNLLMSSSTCYLKIK